MPSGCLLEDVALDDVEEIGAEVAHLVVQHPDAGVEGVVCDQRGDGGEEAHGSCDQRLADRPRDRGEVRVSRRVDVAEGAHDAPDGPEEADERRRGGGRSQEGNTLLESGQLGVGGPGQGARGVLESTQLIVQRTLRWRALRLPYPVSLDLT